MPSDFEPYPGQAQLEFEGWPLNQLTSVSQPHLPALHTFLTIGTPPISEYRVHVCTFSAVRDVSLLRQPLAAFTT